MLFVRRWGLTFEEALVLFFGPTTSHFAHGLSCCQTFSTPSRGSLDVEVGAARVFMIRSFFSWLWGKPIGLWLRITVIVFWGFAICPRQMSQPRTATRRRRIRCLAFRLFAIWSSLVSLASFATAGSARELRAVPQLICPVIKIFQLKRLLH